MSRRTGRRTALGATGVLLAGVLFAASWPAATHAAAWLKRKPTAASRRTGMSTGTPTPAPLPSSAPRAPKPSSVASLSSSDRPYRVVGLGDSVPAGTGCDCLSYVALAGIRAAAQRATTAYVRNLAVSGQTTSGLLDQLTSADLRTELAHADLVVITIGANDFDAHEVTDDSCDPPDLDCYRDDLTQQAANLNKLLDQVNALRPAGGTVLVTGYWNVFLAGQAAADLGNSYVTNSAALTGAENAQIATVSRAHDDTYVDLAAPFAAVPDVTTLLTPDGDHPNAAGHRTIADALENTLAPSGSVPFAHAG